MVIFTVSAARHHRYHNCFYGSEFISELSGRWIQVSRNSEVFWVWITLELFYAALFIGKLALELTQGFPLSRPKH